MGGTTPVAYAPHRPGKKWTQANGRRVPLRRVGPGCLFWIVVSVVLSVALTILLNLGLFTFGW